MRFRSPASSMPRAAASWCAPTFICRSPPRKLWRPRRPQVRALYPFGADDANLVLVKVNREQLQGVVEKVTALIGKKGVVSSELSMREALSGVLFLSQSMGLIIAAIIGLFAAAFVWRATATSVAERRREMAILQAIGWSWRHIGEQVLIENLALAVIGTAAGLPLALVVVLGARARLGDGRSALGSELDAAFHSDGHDQPDANHYRADCRSHGSPPASPVPAAWRSACSPFLPFSLLPRPQPWSLLRAE